MHHVSRLAAMAAAVAGFSWACSSGSSSSAPRTVDLAFTTVFKPGFEPAATRATPPPDGFTATALLFPENTGTGYRTVPIQLDAQQRFSSPNAPAGHYFLQLERSQDTLQPDPLDPGNLVVVPVKELALYELAADRPDLSRASPARADLARQARPDTSLGLALSGLDPWKSSSRLFFVSSQADLGLFVPFLPAPLPAAGSWSGTLPWGGVGAGLASTGDDIWILQRTSSRIGTNTDFSTAAVVTRAGWTNTLAIADGASNPLAVELFAATGGAATFDFRASEFAAIAGQVRPGGTLASGIATVGASPGPVTYPDWPVTPAETNLAVLTATDTSADHVYEVTYGNNALPPSWIRFRRSGFVVGEPLEGLLGDATITSVESTAALVRPIAPVVGPPGAPKLDGLDLDVARTGVGVAPVLSWSAPALGTARSYVVTVSDIAPPAAAGVPYLLTASVRGTSFRIPPGFLQPGRTYRAKITAVDGPGDGDAPFRRGLPQHAADRVTATFAP